MLGIEATTRNDAVQVGMSQVVLPPGVEDGKKTDLGTQMLSIGGDRAQGLGGSLKEDVVLRYGMQLQQRLPR